MDPTQAIPVTVAVALTQIIKASDPKDLLSRFYPALALFVGFFAGFLYGNALGHRWPMTAWDGLQNAAFASLTWTVKQAVAKPLGVRLPGDPGQGGNQP